MVTISVTMVTIPAVLLLLAVSTTDGAVLGSTGDTMAQHADRGYINRRNYLSGVRVVTVCGITTCLAGTQVKPCVENYTMDTCEDCPKGYEMLDDTTSSQDVLSCVKEKNCSDYAYAISSTKDNFCNHGTVRLPCECDAKNNRCGEPCNCKPAPVSCEPGQKLHHDCSCVPDPGQGQLTKDTTTGSTQRFPTKVPPTDQTRSLRMKDYQSTGKSKIRRNPHPASSLPSISQNSSIITTEEKPHSSSTTQHYPVHVNNASPECEDTVSWKTVGTAIGLVLLCVIVVVIVSVVIYKRKDLAGKCPYGDYTATSTSD